ncbi:MAG: SsrA-binding protein [Flavobacteriales bacterium]|jgi:SsrA-binding protein
MAIEIKNKKAAYKYFLVDEYTAGIQLTGTEMKSIRVGKASIIEAFCKFKQDELFLINAYIAEYENGSHANHKPKRERKLLLNRSELTKIQKKTRDQGQTIVPIEMYINERGFVKIRISIAKGKKLHDKRDDLKDKDVKRDMDRRMKE